jgi:outer membrane receptor protein involved in Fe transport
LQVRYFSPKGYFGGLTGSFVDQTVRDTPSGFDQEEESFWVLDLELGYRLPKRRGILSLAVNNLLDQRFLYQDRNYLVNEPTPARYIPDRTIVAKISLSLDALFGGRSH